ncbi:MAG: GAF domain-containing sensor histidine kinase [Actinobacteria bacterium]|nr:GAF domain-containing sensor histidine kinase [Actinomycetota bacterium]
MDKETGAARDEYANGMEPLAKGEAERERDVYERIIRCLLSLGKDARKNIEKIVEAGGEILGGACTLYNRLDGDRGLLCTWSIWHEPEGYNPEDRPEGHICYDVIVGGGDDVVAIENLEGTVYEDTDPNVVKYGLKSYLGCPVSVRGKVVGSYCMCDVRKRRFTALEKQALEMLARAVAVEEERLAFERDLRDYVGIASHELRHPITLVKGYAVHLAQNWRRIDAQEREELLACVIEGAERMDNITRELLDVSRISRGRLSLDRRRCDLVGLVERAVAEMGARCCGESVKLVVVEDPGPKEVDAEKFVSILIILMDNAVCYSPAGSPVEVTLERSGHYALVSVLDRGPGVAEGERERIFERFYRAESTPGCSTGGLGLGLFFAREVVEAHGGSIWCEPREGGGSAFRFIIP